MSDNNPIRKQTLGTYIGLRERGEGEFKNNTSNALSNLKNKQGLYLGVKKTHKAIEPYLPEENRIATKYVSATVKEQLDYMAKSAENYMEIVFSIEKTNASGVVKAELIVEGKSWGEYSSLELLRLKSTLEKSKLRDIYAVLPVREQNEMWKVSENEDFARTGVYENELYEGVTRTTNTTEYILEDNNPGQNRTPVKSARKELVQTGTYTEQKFSGEISIQLRARVITNFNTLYTAVIEALESANSVEIKKSDLGLKVFDYLHAGL